MMQKKLLAIGSFSGLISVALGAFGAHALKVRLETEQLSVFETAVRYQFYHSLAIILVSLFSDKFQGKKMLIPGYLFTAGILIFSGSLYFLVASYLIFAEPLKWLGAITPLGGLCFMAGWFSLFFFALQNKSDSI